MKELQTLHNGKQITCRYEHKPMTGETILDSVYSSGKEITGNLTGKELLELRDKCHSEASKLTFDERKQTVMEEFYR